MILFTILFFFPNPPPERNKFEKLWAVIHKTQPTLSPKANPVPYPNPRTISNPNPKPTPYPNFKDRLKSLKNKRSQMIVQ